MKFIKNTVLIGLSLALPLSMQAVCQANTLNVDSPSAADVAAQVHAAKDRLETAKVRLEIAKKQVTASKARLKAAEAEFKAAKANHEARNLSHEAYKLSESSGLPAITNTLIEENKQRSLASRFVKKPNKKQDAVGPAAPTSSQAVDLSDTRIHPVDFNAPGFENKQVNDPAVPHSSFVPKQRVSTSQSDVGTGLVANSPGLEQPPIVP